MKRFRSTKTGRVLILAGCLYVSRFIGYYVIAPLLYKKKVLDEHS
jgi:hypothetical protein